MDTHMNHIVPDTEGAGLSARLPGEPDCPQSAPGSAPPPTGDFPTAARPRPWRGRLLLGTSLVVLATVGGVGFLASPYNTVYPMPGLTAQVRSLATSVGQVVPAVRNGAQHVAEATGLSHPQPKPVLAPSTALAGISVPPKPAPVREGHESQSRSQQVQSIVGLRAATSTPDVAPPPRPEAQPPVPAPGVAATRGPSASPVRGDQAPPAASTAEGVAMEPGSQLARGVTPLASRPILAVSAEPAKDALPPPALALPTAQVPGAPIDVTRQVLAAAIPSAVPASQAAPAAVAVVPVIALTPAPVANASAGTVPIAAPEVTPQPPDAIQLSQRLRAAPMVPEEEVQVLGIVTEMGRMVRDLRQQDQQLRADFRKYQAETKARLDDFARRLALAEARSAVAAAGEAGSPPLLEAPASPLPAALPGVLQIAARPASVAIVPAPGFPATAVPGSTRLRSLKVQAASPTLAMLSEVDRTAAGGPPIEVKVGDTLPEVGRVKAITQRGTAWVVVGERGTIQ